MFVYCSMFIPLRYIYIGGIGQATVQETEELLIYCNLLFTPAYQHTQTLDMFPIFILSYLLTL